MPGAAHKEAEDYRAGLRSRRREDCSDTKQDPAPGADHPLPHAAAVRAAEPRHQGGGGGGVGQVREGAGLPAQADPGHDGLVGGPRVGEL